MAQRSVRWPEDVDEVVLAEAQRLGRSFAWVAVQCARMVLAPGSEDAGAELIRRGGALDVPAQTADVPAEAVAPTRPPARSADSGRSATPPIQRGSESPSLKRFAARIARK